MRHLKYAGLLIGILSLTSCKEKVEALGMQIGFERKSLSNGLTVIFVEDPTTPVVSYQTWFKVGSVDEMPGKTGIAHLFEHLMFRGTPRFGPGEFFRVLEARGAEVNAQTSRDHTVFYNLTSPRDLDQVVELEADRLAHLTFREETLQSERLIALEERRIKSESSPDSELQEAVWQLAFRAHPYHWPVTGLPGDLQRIRLPDLQDFFATYFQPSNATIIVVGSFHASHVWSQIKKHYSAIPSRSRPPRKVFQEPPQTEERRLVMRGKTRTPRFVEGYHIPAAHDPDSHALDALATLVFEGPESRAYRKLVLEKKVAVSVSGTAYTPTYPGLFLVQANLRPRQDITAAEEELDEIWHELGEKAVSQQELQTAIKKLTLQLVDQIRTPHGLAQLIGAVQMVYDDPTRFAGDLSAYSRLTPADIQRVARKYFDPNNRSVVESVPGGSSGGTP